VRPQEGVHLGQRAGEHGRHLAREGLPGAPRIAVADEHEIGKRAQLARRGERVPTRATGRRLQLLGGEVQDRQVERLVGEPGQPLGDRVDLEHEPFARERAHDPRPLGPVRERDQEAFLSATRGVP